MVGSRSDRPPERACRQRSVCAPVQAVQDDALLKTPPLDRLPPTPMAPVRQEFQPALGPRLFRPEEQDRAARHRPGRHAIEMLSDTQTIPASVRGQQWHRRSPQRGPPLPRSRQNRSIRAPKPCASAAPIAPQSATPNPARKNHRPAERPTRVGQLQPTPRGVALPPLRLPIGPLPVVRISTGPYRRH